MTARPDAPELTAAERQFLDRPDEPESLRERMARAMQAVDDVVGSPVLPWDDDDADRAAYRRLADAALAVVRGETS